MFNMYKVTEREVKFVLKATDNLKTYHMAKTSTCTLFAICDKDVYQMHISQAFVCISLF